MTLRTATDATTGEIDAALLSVARVMNQVRVHAKLRARAGVDIDRAGGAVLYKLLVEPDSPRLCDLAERLGIDSPAVTRKVQQLEHEGYVARHPDPDDRRATRIALSPAGRRTLQRVLDARRAWIASLFEGWDRADLGEFASALGRFSTTLEGETADTE